LQKSQVSLKGYEHKVSAILPDNPPLPSSHVACLMALAAKTSSSAIKKKRKEIRQPSVGGLWHFI
jgi:hypothetical protein